MIQLAAVPILFRHLRRCRRATHACFRWILRARDLRGWGDVAPLLRSLVGRGYLRETGGRYSLTPAGERFAGPPAIEPLEWQLAAFAVKVRQLRTKGAPERAILHELVTLADRLVEEEWTCGPWDKEGFDWAYEVLNREPVCVSSLELCQINRILVHIARTEHFHGYMGGYTGELWERGVLPALAERVVELFRASPCPTLRAWMEEHAG